LTYISTGDSVALYFFES